MSSRVQQQGKTSQPTNSIPSNNIAEQQVCFKLPVTDKMRDERSQDKTELPPKNFYQNNDEMSSSDSSANFLKPLVNLFRKSKESKRASKRNKEQSPKVVPEFQSAFSRLLKIFSANSKRKDEHQEKSENMAPLPISKSSDEYEEGRLSEVCGWETFIREKEKKSSVSCRCKPDIENECLSDCGSDFSSYEWEGAVPKL